MAKAQTGLQQLAPVEATSLNQAVYVQLRQAIMAGKFRPGEVLTLRGLAAALGTSIMPARDAVLRLSAERALEPIGRGARVPILDLQRFEDITRFRIALEGDAAALAAQRASAAEIARMEQACARVLKAQQGGALEKLLQANQEFHFTVYRGAHNDLLQSLIETLWLQIGPHLAALTNSDEITAASSGNLIAHDELVAAIRLRRPEAAREAIRADLQESIDVYRPFHADVPIPTASSRKRA